LLAPVVHELLMEGLQLRALLVVIIIIIVVVVKDKYD
jgi:hypothetical protein